MLKTKKIRKKELINDYFDEDLNIFWRSRNGIKENMPESKVENTIEKEKKRRCRYSLNFKKKWVDIFNKDVKLFSFSKTLFAFNICGRDENLIISKGQVNESTFRKWIKLYKKIKLF